jgi:TrwC relaxase
VAVLDLTFSAPKSVSVLAAVAPAEVTADPILAHEVRRGVDGERVLAGDARLSRGDRRPGRAPLSSMSNITSTEPLHGATQAAARDRCHSRTTGLIAGACRHHLSRALDPQLHTHVVAANITGGPDGRFTGHYEEPWLLTSVSRGDRGRPRRDPLPHSDIAFAPGPQSSVQGLEIARRMPCAVARSIASTKRGCSSTSNTHQICRTRQNGLTRSDAAGTVLPVSGDDHRRARSRPRL